MNTQFEIKWLEANRNTLLSLLNNTPEDQLFEIPKGFNNNIIWQIGHMVVSQQRVLYMRSGLPMHISSAYHDLFKNGSSPKSWVDQPDLNEVKHTLLDTVDQLKQDLTTDRFNTYDPLVLPSGLVVSNHLQGLSYTNLHEAEHTGMVRAMLRSMQPAV